MNMQFDPTSPEFRAYPYPFYDQLRSLAPIFYWEPGNMWFLTRYEDCRALLSEKRLGHENVSPSMLFQNPPDHTRLRGLVSRAFTPRMIEQYRDRVQAITHRLLEAVQADGHMDLIAQFAYLLPVTLIAEMLGVPPEDHRLFQQWSKQLVKGLDLIDKTAEVQEELETAIAAFNAYFSSLIEARRTAPQDDLLSALVAAEASGDRLSEPELYATCRLLLVAGHETTVNLIGNGVLALLRHEDPLRQLQEHPELIAPAIEELLRYDGPIQLISRTVLEEVVYQGHTLRQGQVVGFLIGAANRDPEQFEQPGQLDLTRRHNPHLAFGHGIHYCLGAPLARLEGQIAINALLQCMPKLTLATETLTYQDNFVFRGLEALPVSW